MTKDYLSLPKAARALGVSTPTLKKLALEGKITYTKIGNRYRFLPQDIDTYIKECTHNATSNR